VTSTEVGEHVMEVLRALDEVAYVRFASVYRHFRDASQFMDAVQSLRSTPGGAGPGEVEGGGAGPGEVDGGGAGPGEVDGGGAPARPAEDSGASVSEAGEGVG
jgi:hypothetical protein